MRRARAAQRFGVQVLAWLVWPAWLAGAIGGALSTARADQVQVQVSGASCPDAALVEQKLAPLLPDSTLVVGSDADAQLGGSPAGSARAAVRDLGARYVIEVGALSREVEDPARDCTERARVAAVFIALNLGAAGAAKEEPKPAEEPKPEAEAEGDEGEDDAADDDWQDDGLRVGVRLLGDGAYASAIDRATLGASAGVFVADGPLRFAFTLGALAPARVPLGAGQGAVSLLRVPIAASAEYSLRFGPFFAGPALGLVLDVLRMRGLEVERAQTELRLGPGVMLAVDVGARLSRVLLLRLRAHGTAFARAYDLRVEPLGALERTPRLWLGASLGLDWQL